MKWFKFYGQDYLSDPKMLSLTASERSCWITLLAYGSVNDNGVIAFLSEEQLMIQSGLDFTSDKWDKTKGVLGKFEKLGMLQNSNGEITVTNWKKRQETFLSNAERQARYREKHKSNAEVTQPLRKSNARIDKNRIEENRIDTNTGGASPPREKKKHNTLGEEVIKAFESVDPKCKKYYGNTTQRAACDFLIEQHGLEKVLKVVALLVRTNKMSYMPTITTPCQLVDKWVSLESQLTKKKNESNGEGRGRGLA